MTQPSNNLILLLKQSRDRRERFFLRGSLICYQAPDNVENPRLIKTRLQQVVESETFVNELEGKIERRPRMTVEIELLHSLFCTYDITATYSEDIPYDLARDIKTLIRRIHLSRDGNINPGDLPSGAVASLASGRLDPFELKVSKLELCLIDNDSNGQKDCRFEQDLLHELFVMFLYTNRLRKIIPNFQLCYAGFKSSRPSQSQMDADRTECVGICPCDTSQTVDYLLLEKIPGIKMSKAVEICNLQEFLSMMLQIAFTLELGAIHFGFTHYNLHPDNVVIRSIPRTKTRYFHHNKILLLETTSVAVLTNFETSHVKHKYEGVPSDRDDKDETRARNEFVVNHHEHFGAVGYDSLGIFYNETRPFYDLYKILMFSLQIMRTKNKTVYKEARKLAKFFGFVYLTELETALKEEYKLGYMYSKSVSDKERVRSVRDFVAHILYEFPSISSFLTPIEDYTQFNYLNCQGYCLFGDYPLETAKVQPSQSKNTADHTMDVTLRELLVLFSTREFIERYQGLKKRSDELQKKAGILCNVNDKLCKNFVEEALEATGELEGFRQLVEYGKFEIWRRGIESIERERTQIDEMIRMNNMDVESHLRQVQSLSIKGVVDEIEVKSSIIPSRELICYHREQIKGRLAILVNMVSSLVEFDDEFKVGQVMPEFVVDGLIPFDSDL